MTQNLTIVLVSAFPPSTQSLNEYGYHMARALIARKDVARVIVIADKCDAPPQELDMGEKLEVHRVWRFNAPSTMFAILRHLRRLKVQNVIFNLQTASFGDREIPAALGLLTPMMARLLGINSGVIAHNMIAALDLDKTILKGQRFRQMIIKMGGAVISRALMNANYVTVTLTSYEAALKRKYPRADITHIPHGTFDTQERHLLPLAKRPKTIVTMGKFGTYKRLETLLAAFDIIRQDKAFKDYRLVIGGSDHPNTAGYMSRMAQRHAGDKNVHFNGYVAEEDIPNFFSNAQLSIFDYEATTGSSGVLHQTASYGAVPIFPQIEDFVDVSKAEGLRGYNYQPRSAQDMAKAIRAALADLETAQKIGENNRKAAMGMPMSQVIDFHVKKLF